jgi:hypothetical protein
VRSAFAHISAWIFGLIYVPAKALASSSPTPRAVQQRPQPYTGMPFSFAKLISSVSGGNPTP